MKKTRNQIMAVLSALTGFLKTENPHRSPNWRMWVQTDNDVQKQAREEFVNPDSNYLTLANGSHEASVMCWGATQELADKQVELICMIPEMMRLLKESEEYIKLLKEFTEFMEASCNWIDNDCERSHLAKIAQRARDRLIKDAL